MDTKQHELIDCNRTALTSSQLLERAAQFVAALTMELHEGSRGRTKTIVTYPLAGLDRTAMENAGLRSESNSRMTTFALDNGGYWNFRHDHEHTDQITIALSAIASISETDRGVAFIPCAHGTFLSPADNESHRRMFRFLASIHPEAPDIVQKLAQDRVVVRWSEIGLGGIRSIERLFSEFCKGNETLRRLAISILNPFSPNPFSRDNVEEDRFIEESAQPNVLAGWRRQLHELCSRLSAY
ncbi:MAG: hypothetical protein HY422_01610 [Candidatus Komeilibacteria bacterium]|nr:hypothetical protein [Candidatus Komeilibacteria bacterium]